MSDKLWQEANDALSGKGKNRKRAVLDRNTHQTLLKGIIRCGECGHRLTPKPGGKKDRDGNPYLYYTCNNVSKDGKAASCSLRNVPARAMDDFVIQILGEIGRRPEIIKAAVASSNEEKSKSIRPLKSKLAQLQRQHTDMARNSSATSRWFARPIPRTSGGKPSRRRKTWRSRSTNWNRKSRR